MIPVVFVSTTATLGSCLWKRVPEGVNWKEVGDVGEVRHK